MSNKDHKEQFSGELSSEDNKLWAKESQKVKKLKEHNIHAEKVGPKKNKSTNISKQKTPEKNSNAETRLTKKSINKKDTVIINGKKLSIESILDLHGMNQDQAYKSVQDFIGFCWKAKYRCLLIITGTGKYKKVKGDSSTPPGVLRESLPKWLDTNLFLKYVSTIKEAEQRHGGKGAFYVLLKKK